MGIVFYLSLYNLDIESERQAEVPEGMEELSNSLSYGLRRLIMETKFSWVWKSNFCVLLNEFFD